MLVNCNALSQIHLQKANAEFKKHVQLLNEVKKDLENIFKRIKIMKAKAAAQYPHQFEGYRHFSYNSAHKICLYNIFCFADALSKVQTSSIEEEDEKGKDA